MGDFARSRHPNLWVYHPLPEKRWARFASRRYISLFRNSGKGLAFQQPPVGSGVTCVTAAILVADLRGQLVFSTQDCYSWSWNVFVPQPRRRNDCLRSYAELFLADRWFQRLQKLYPATLCWPGNISAQSIRSFVASLSKAAPRSGVLGGNAHR